ncbi:MAG: hypothetical protein ACRD1R_02055 [Acidobacteriota bacterium]
MQERDFFQERTESKPAQFTCPYCKQAEEYQIRWLVREKRKQPPGGGSAEDRKRFEKARSYMMRLDDQLVCRNPRCRKRFEIPSQHSVVTL